MTSSLSLCLRLSALLSLTLASAAARADGFECSSSGHGSYALHVEAKQIRFNTGAPGQKEIVYPGATASAPIEGGVSTDELKIYLPRAKRPAQFVLRKAACSTLGEGPSSEHAWNWVGVVDGKVYEGCCDGK